MLHHLRCWKVPFLKIHRNQNIPRTHTHKSTLKYKFSIPPTLHLQISTNINKKNHGKCETWKKQPFQNMTETNNIHHIHHIHQALPQKGWCNRCSPHLLGLALEMPRPCTTRLRLWRSRGHRSCRDWWLHRFEWPTNFCSNTPFWQGKLWPNFFF